MNTITTEDLQNAKIDAETLGLLMNAPEDYEGTGLVTTRLGRVLPTFARVIGRVANRTVSTSPPSGIPVDNEEWLQVVEAEGGPAAGLFPAASVGLDPIAGFPPVNIQEAIEDISGRVATNEQTASPVGSKVGQIDGEFDVLGASVDTVVIPNRAIVLAVSVRTVIAITGASSFDCGISGEISKFGGSLGAALNSSNIGVIGPQAFYSDTAVSLTANGSNFTAGRVAVRLHYMLLDAPDVV